MTVPRPPRRQNDCLFSFRGARRVAGLKACARPGTARARAELRTGSFRSSNGRNPARPTLFLSPMSELKPRQKELLARIVRAGGLPLRAVDGRSVRPLRTARLVEVDGERLVPTLAGRRQVGKAAGPPPDRIRLNPRQEDLLRMLVRIRQVPAEELDGRVVRPLIARGLATVSDDDIVSPTSAGRVYLEEPPSVRRRRKAGRQDARAAAIRRAVRRLEAAIPEGAEVQVGSIMAAADDVVDAFLRHARRLERVS